MAHIKSRLRSALAPRPQPRPGQSRWFLSAFTALDAAAFLLRLWQARSLASGLGPFADLRASLWESLAPVLVFHGTILALLVGASLWSWAAWRRERRQMP